MLKIAAAALIALAGLGGGARVQAQSAVRPVPRAYYDSSGCNKGRGGAFTFWNATAYCYAAVSLPGFSTEFRTVITSPIGTSTGPWREIGGGQSSLTGYIAYPGTVLIEKR